VAHGNAENVEVREMNLDESYAYCKGLSRRTARNFYYSFLALPQDKFPAMCVLYAFMRLSDDLGDDGAERPLAERRRDLEAWRVGLARALEGDAAAHPVFPALADIVARYRIPHEYLFAVIEGVQMDLHPVRFDTFDQLATYCYHVAGVVGLCCIHVWGFHDRRALGVATSCGLAFQLTNILRDLKEDALLNRVYLPQEDLDRFGYTREDLAQGCRDARFAQLMEFEVARARGYYAEARQLFDYLDPAGKPILETMLKIYGGLLDEIERRKYDVFSKRVRLSTWRKLCFAAQGILRQRWHRLLRSN
jgi:phytoene synthase